MSKRSDKMEALLSIAAAALAFRGVDPREVGARAERAAQAFALARTRLEDLMIAQVQRALGCRAPAPCDCAVCTEYAADQRSRRKTKPEASC